MLYRHLYYPPPLFFALLYLNTDVFIGQNVEIYGSWHVIIDYFRNIAKV